MYWLSMGTERFPLREGETTIGRSPYCSIVVPSATASREHAAVVVQGQAVELVDLGSRNGTLVNRATVREPCTLNVGDIIQIGGAEMTLLETDFDTGEQSTTQERALPDLETRPPNANPELGPETVR